MAHRDSNVEHVDKISDGWLLDTNIISAVLGDRVMPPRLHDFFERVRDERLRLSVLTIAELRKGVSLLPGEATKRAVLLRKLDELESQWSDRILPIDTAVARKWGELSAAYQPRGEPIPVVGGLIAATASVHNLALATHDKAFARIRTEIALYDPLGEEAL